MQNEVEIKLSNGRSNIEDIFVLVEASKITMNDEILKYEAETYSEKTLKKDIQEAIKANIKDFYCPIIDPSFDENENLYYCIGKPPAINKKLYKWWRKTAIEFFPERDSRLGNIHEWAIFLATLMKRIMEEKGWDLKQTWDSICNNSDCFRINPPIIYPSQCQLTGSWEVCGFYDLLNTFKLLEEDNDETFQYHGCNFFEKGKNFNIATKTFLFEQYLNGDYSAVGWIVLH